MKKRLFIYDFETNGLWNPLNQPIQVCIKIVNKNGKTKEYNKYIKCPMPLHPDIVKLTGITDAKLRKHGEPIEKVFKEIDKLLRVKDTLVVGHNILTFDNLFLNYYLQYHEYKMITNDICFDTSAQTKADKIGETKEGGISWGKFHRSVLAKRKKGVRHRLKDACDYYGIKKSKKFHTAKSDVDYTYKVFKKQIEKLKGL